MIRTLNNPLLFLLLLILFGWLCNYAVTADKDTSYSAHDIRAMDRLVERSLYGRQMSKTNAVKMIYVFDN